MKSRMNKLELNQETLRKLTTADLGFFGHNPNTKSCVSVCGLPCTPVAGPN